MATKGPYKFMPLVLNLGRFLHLLNKYRAPVSLALVLALTSLTEQFSVRVKGHLQSLEHLADERLFRGR